MPTLKAPKDGPLHKKWQRKIDDRMALGLKGRSDREAIWQKNEELTLAYLPETEADAKRHSKRDSGTPTYTTIQIPYTYALLMSAHTYWTSVFFARSPVHQFSGRHGEAEQKVQAMEALIGYQVEVANFLPPYFIWLYDAGKYGHGVLGTYWDRQKVHYGQLVEMDDPVLGTKQLWQATQEVEGYAGNCAYNVSPWDFVSDPRVQLKHFQKGEFCAIRKRMTWNDILRRKDAGYFNDNIDKLSQHVQDKSSSEGSSSLKRPDFSSVMFEADDETKKHPAGAVFWEFYVDLIPKEWDVGTANYPQKWCFTVTEDRGLIVGASPLGYAHGKFPVDVLECEVEGYGMHARGVPEIMNSTQNTIDWLLNVHFWNVRAALNNQFIVDPSKLVVKDVQNSGPGFIWRLRPEAYGTDISKMFAQVPVQDVTRGNMQDIQAMLGMGERIMGINDQVMGSLGGQARKTATEVRTTTGFSVNRLKTMSEWMSASGFAPHAQKLVQTSQQMYDATQKLRRVGSFALEAGEKFLNVSPQDIAGFYDFVPVDGNLPVDRMAQANLWKELLAGMGRMPPQVQMSYDWGRIFAWVAQLAGLKNINQFKIQVLPDQQLIGQAERGNVIPMPQRQLPGPAVTPGNSASTAVGLNALGGEGGDDGGYAG